MKYAADRPFADPEKAARRILEIANSVEPIQGRIHIEKINEPFLFRDRGSPAEYGAGLKLAIDRGWLKCTTPEPSSPSRRPAPSCSPRRAGPPSIGYRLTSLFFGRAASLALSACQAS